jgi:hypothetical protein
VKLTDGRSGIVVSVPEDALDRPVVRIIGGAGAGAEVALADDPTLGVSGWDHYVHDAAVAA